MTEPGAFYIDFGSDHNIAHDLTGSLDKLGIGYRLTASNKLVLNESAVEDLRKQPIDANGGISNDEDNVPCMWVYGYAYPVMPASGPVA